MLHLGYPGGPRVQAMAEKGNPQALSLPRPMRGQGYAFSFSGLKTAVHHALGKATPEDLCASFQEAVVDVLVEKTLRAAREHRVQNVCLAGGVAANQRLRSALAAACSADKRRLCVPAFGYCTDNGAMIAMAAYQLARLGIVATPALDAHASLPLRSWRIAQ
jgi:N6-L-threonylcarbamoyladenine synthase